MDGLSNLAGWASVIGALALLFNQIANAIPKLAQARLTDSERKKVDSDTARAKAETAKIEAEERRLAEENTGTFMKAHNADREQAAEAFRELRKQLAEANARALGESRRADEIESSRTALWKENNELRNQLEQRRKS